MPTPALTIEIMKVSQYLASADIAKGNLYGKRVDPRLPTMLYVERRGLQDVYAKDPNYDGIQQVSDYCYALCAPYQFTAENIVNGGGGGMVPSPTPNQSFPIYITELDFLSSTEYDNPVLSGNMLMIYLNEINRYLSPPQNINATPEFVLTPTGIEITLDGFDARSFTYNLLIEKVS